MESKRMSVVAKEFLTKKLNTINISHLDVPGIGPASYRKLERFGIKTTNHLIGHFFLCDQDEKTFSEFLVDKIGMQEMYADYCAEFIKMKFSCM